MTYTSASILRQLVSFDTTSRNSNLSLIEWSANHLRSCGARVELIHNAERNKANLLASIGPIDAGGIVLSGHTDVVPVDGQQWNSDPFLLEERDGRLYGRGSSDMKGFIACALAAAQNWRSATLRRPIHFALSYDEEIGCLGAHSLVDRIIATLPPPALVIVGEPTDMRIGVAHSGVTGLLTGFHGTAAHASNPALGVNAIDAAAAFIGFLGEVARSPKIGETGCTVNVGRIAGGSATNIVAEHCQVWWEYRTKGQGATAIPNLVAGYLKTLDMQVDSNVELDAPHFTSSASEQILDLITCFGARRPATILPFCSEAGIFERHNIPTVVCGPGSIDQAHRPDEWVACSAIDEADKFMAAIGSWAR